MNRRLTGQLVLLAGCGILLLVLTNTWARQGSVWSDLDLLVDVRHELVTNYVEEPDRGQLVRAAVEGMIESLNDPYTSYIPPEDAELFDHMVTGSFSGIGAEVDMYEDRLRIVTPLEDSPAWKAGVMAGDIVLEIDGESTLGMDLTEAVKRLTGEPGTQVTIRVRHESGEEQTLTITREVIRIQTVRGFLRGADQHFDFMLDEDRGIGYVRITQFTERTAEELREALEQLEAQGLRALILDVRFNPGGLLDSAVEVSDMFLEEGKTIVAVEGRVVPRQASLSTEGTVIDPSVPIVVLANEASASAAEIVTGALKDNDRALVIGTRTFGKGSVQQVKALEGDQGALKFTNAYYYIPSGRIIHRRESSDVWGVDPSEGSYVPMAPEQVREMLRIRRESDRIVAEQEAADGMTITPQWMEQELKDPQLAAALRAVEGRLADGTWPQVGQSNVDALIKANQRANLVLRRDLLEERLEEIERELAALEAGEPQPADADAADTAADREAIEDETIEDLAPTDPEAVQEEVERTQEGVIESDELVPAE